MNSQKSLSSVSISADGVHINHRDSSSTRKKIEGVNIDSSHHYSDGETMAFTNHINYLLENDPLVSKRLGLPIDPSSEDIFFKLDDGLILMKLINLVKPGTIVEKLMNKGLNLSVYQKQENLNLCIAGAKAIGCQVVNIGGQDIIAGRPTLILGLLWQLIKLQLLAKVTIEQHPEVKLLREGNETEVEFAHLSAEQLLLRWINFHLRSSGETHGVPSFNDIKVT
jgi:hypothetical protein